MGIKPTFAAEVQDDLTLRFINPAKIKQHLPIVFSRIMADVQNFDPVQLCKEFAGNDLRADGYKVGRCSCVNDSFFHNCKTSVGKIVAIG